MRLPLWASANSPERALHDEGLSILNLAGAARRVAGMANGNVSRQPSEIFFGKSLGNKTHLPMDVKGHTVTGGNTRAFLATVLQRVQPKVGYTCDILSRRIYPKAPHMPHAGDQAYHPQLTLVFIHRRHLFIGAYITGCDLVHAPTYLPVLARHFSEHDLGILAMLPVTHDFTSNGTRVTMNRPG